MLANLCCVFTSSNLPRFGGVAFSTTFPRLLTAAAILDFFVCGFSSSLSSSLSSSSCSSSSSSSSSSSLSSCSMILLRSPVAAGLADDALAGVYMRIHIHMSRVHEATSNTFRNKTLHWYFVALEEWLVLNPVTYPWAAAGWGCFGSSFGYRLCCSWRRLCRSSGPGWFHFGWRRGRCSGGALRRRTRRRGTRGIFEVSWERWGAGACVGSFRRPGSLNRQHVERRQNKHFCEIMNENYHQQQYNELLCA